MSSENTMITPERIRAAKTRDVLTETSSPGLRLTIGKGATTWSYRYITPERKLQQVKLGHYPAMSIERARFKWEELREKRANGEDLAAQRNATRKAQREASERRRAESITVRQIANEYLHGHVKAARNEKSFKEVERLFRVDISEPFASRPAIEVTRPMAADFLKRVRADSSARLLRAELRAAWNRALDDGTLSGSASNPWIDVLKGNPRMKQGKRDRTLSESEIATLLNWLPTAPKLSQDNRDVLELTLRLGVRSGEACAAEWRDIDLKRRKWTLRSENVKTGSGRVIVLPDAALAIFKRRQEAEDRDAIFVFPSPLAGRSVRQSSIGWALSFAREHFPEGLYDFNAHDLRRTARTHWSPIARSAGLGDVACEAGLGHSRGGVAGIYDLHKYEDDVAELLAKWNTKLDALKSGTDGYQQRAS